MWHPFRSIVEANVYANKNGWSQGTTQQNEEIEGGSQTTTSLL